MAFTVSPRCHRPRRIRPRRHQDRWTREEPRFVAAGLQPLASFGRARAFGRQHRRECRAAGTGATLDNGTVFRVLGLARGRALAIIAQNSIDFAVVMSGEIDMELDSSTVI